MRIENNLTSILVKEGLKSLGIENATFIIENWYMHEHITEAERTNLLKFINSINQENID